MTYIVHHLQVCRKAGRGHARGMCMGRVPSVCQMYGKGMSSVWEKYDACMDRVNQEEYDRCMASVWQVYGEYVECMGRVCEKFSMSIHTSIICHACGTCMA